MGSRDIVDEIDKLIETGVPVDVLALRQTIQAIETWTSLLLGIIVWGLLVGIILVSALDIAYLTIPLMRNKISEVNWDKPGGFRLVSRDAQRAMEQFYEGGSGYLSFYLKRRIGVYITVGLLLTILLAGGWQMLLSLIRPFAENIAKWLYGL